MHCACYRAQQLFGELGKLNSFAAGQPVAPPTTDLKQDAEELTSHLLTSTLTHHRKQEALDKLWPSLIQQLVNESIVEIDNTLC